MYMRAVYSNRAVLTWAEFGLLYVEQLISAHSATLCMLTAVVLLGMYQYSISRAGVQAQQWAAKSHTSFWLCSSNLLRQPLIPKHATAEDAC